MPLGICICSEHLFQRLMIPFKSVPTIKRAQAYNAIGVLYITGNPWSLGVLSNGLEIEQALQSIAIVKYESLQVLPYLDDICEDGPYEYIWQPPHHLFAQLVTKWLTKSASKINVKDWKHQSPWPILWQIIIPTYHHLQRRHFSSKVRLALLSLC